MASNRVMVVKQRKDTHMGLGEAALKGTIAASVGGMAMKLFWDAEDKLLLPEEERLGSPTKKAVRAMAEQRDIHLSETQTSMGAAAFYGGTMAGWGAIYGMVRNRLDPPPLLTALLVGGALYTLNFPSSTGILPKLGVLPPPARQPKKPAAVPIVAHVAFAIATATAFKALK